MPFREIYTAAFNNDSEYGQLLLQTAAALQTNKFIQVSPSNQTASLCLSHTGVRGFWVIKKYF